MRSYWPWLGIAPILYITSGCSIAPDIADVTRLDTAAVVRHIECETRIAILQNIVEYIKENAKDKDDAAKVSSAFDGDLITALEQTRNLKLEALYQLAAKDDDLATYIAGWDGVVIGYGYSFDISEQNINSAGLDFAIPIGIHIIKMGATAGLDTMRQNKKQFNLVTSVPNLMQSRACLSREMVEMNRYPIVPTYSPIGHRGKPDSETIDNIARSQLPNPLYPIAGSVGMADVLQTFSEVWRGNVGGQARATALQPRKKGVYYGLLPGAFTVPSLTGETGEYVQTLNFTTKVSGKISPIIEVVGSSLTKGTLSTDNNRIDKHQVIITISAPSNKEILESKKRTVAARKKNEMDIAAFISGNVTSAQKAVNAAAPGINETINRERQLLALERLSIDRR